VLLAKSLLPLTAGIRWSPLLNLLSRLLPSKNAPVPDWDDEYASGGWDWLSNIGQAPHNYVIAGYCRHLMPQATILEVGCGQGTLHAILHQIGYRLYVGIDVSEFAIRRAASRTDDRTRFFVAQGECFETDERFDIIVLNEVLYYFRRPMAVIAHLSALFARAASLSFLCARRAFVTHYVSN